MVTRPPPRAAPVILQIQYAVSDVNFTSPFFDTADCATSAGTKVGAESARSNVASGCVVSEPSACGSCVFRHAARSGSARLHAGSLGVVPFSRDGHQPSRLPARAAALRFAGVRSMSHTAPTRCPHMRPQVRALEMAASTVDLVAAFGWCVTWWMSYVQLPGQGWTLDDPDTWCVEGLWGW